VLRRTLPVWLTDLREANPAGRVLALVTLTLAAGAAVLTAGLLGG
jgi:hypothetical protein